MGISSAPVKKNANRANEMAILFSYQQTVNLVTVCSFSKDLNLVILSKVSEGSLVNEARSNLLFTFLVF